MTHEEEKEEDRKTGTHEDNRPSTASDGTEGPRRPRPLYDVYGREIDPRNVMPLNPNQIAHPDQKRKLPVEREVSSIPKGQGEAWQYPSEQMFYNALKRKGKGDDVDEDMVGTILKIHNNMNEQTWEKVVEWERLHISACNEYPTLTRFMGRPNDLSPRAWLAHHVLGKDKPFDRHDWFVSRCGREVRYVIDYYHDEGKSPLDQLPKNKNDKEAIKSISVKVRPALDSLDAVVDRTVRMPLYARLGWGVDTKREWVSATIPPRSSGTSENQCPVDHAPKPIDKCPVDHGSRTVIPPPPTKTPTPLAPLPDFDHLTREDLLERSKEIQTKCHAAFEGLRACSQEAECQKLSVSLYHCMGIILCPAQAEAFKMDTTNVEKFDRLLEGIGKFEARAEAVLRTKKNKTNDDDGKGS